MKYLGNLYFPNLMGSINCNMAVKAIMEIIKYVYEIFSMEIHIYPNKGERVNKYIRKDINLFDILKADNLHVKK